MSDYVILGGGCAAVSAAEAIRSRDSQGSITMIYEENGLPYNRPMLTKALLSGLEESKIQIHPQAWYDANKIEVVSGAEITALDVKAKKVTLKDGREFAYGKCIYALGAKCFVPPIKGADNPLVMSIRTLDDVRKIEAAIAGKQKVVCIGGGVLGLEGAWELAKGGKEVTILEAMDRLMPRQLDEKASALVRGIAQDKGIRLFTGMKITDISKEDEGVSVNTETVDYPCDMVIVSAGVRARVDLAKAAGLAVGRGVTVNEKMETSEPDVYACGDCAEYNGTDYALWSQAKEEGTVAGSNASGGQAQYSGAPAALMFFGLETQLYAAGDNGSDPKKQYKTLEVYDEAGKIYRKCYFLEDHLCGILQIGTLAKVKELGKALEAKASFHDAAVLLNE